MGTERDSALNMEAAKAAILKDLRDRRLLKWLFREDADTDPHPIGYVDGPIDRATQDEIAEALAQAALSAAGVREPDPAEFEIWQGDERVAGCSGPRESAMREAAHYALVYGQDGEVEVQEIIRRPVARALLAKWGGGDAG